MNVGEWEILFALGAGLGLAAACGLRVFAPLFVLGLAARFGPLSLSLGFAWAESTPALLALGLATLLEISAYYVPWLDHVLDAVAAPAALLAGALVVAALMGDLPPWLRWSVAIIAGGGLAGLTQAATTLLRLKSTATTGGLANPVVATGEWIGAITLAVIAVLLPLLALAVAVGLVVLALRMAQKLGGALRPAPRAPQPGR